MPYRGEPHLETTLESCLNKELYYLIFKNHTFVTPKLFCVFHFNNAIFFV